MKLLVLDVEGTLFRTSVRLPGTEIDSTIWQALAHALGKDAIREEVDTHTRWQAGQYSSYIAWMIDTISIHVRHGLSASHFRTVIASAEYHDEVREVLQSLDRSKFVPVLITGGFRELAARVQADCDVHHAFAACEYLFRESGTLASYNLLPCDFEGKTDFVRLMLREYKLGADDWIFVGDGLNDVPIAKAAPVSIAFRGHPKLQEVATHRINRFSEVLSLLNTLGD